jgi:hypothetical protein
LGALDDHDHQNGINYAMEGVGATSQKGLATPLTGTVRNQEDAAFVCTNIFVAQQANMNDIANVFTEGFENPFAEVNLLVRFTDMNTGRNLVSGFSTGPTDLDRGLIPLSYLSSSRFGMAAAVKNKLFAEFTIPRAGAVRVELFDAELDSDSGLNTRFFFTLFGFKVYGG